jgi:hypothetical protein
MTGHLITSPTRLGRSHLVGRRPTIASLSLLPRCRWSTVFRLFVGKPISLLWLPPHPATIQQINLQLEPLVITASNLTRGCHGVVFLPSSGILRSQSTLHMPQPTCCSTTPVDSRVWHMFPSAPTLYHSFCFPLPIASASMILLQAKSPVVRCALSTVSMKSHDSHPLCRMDIDPQITASELQEVIVQVQCLVIAARAWKLLLALAVGSARLLERCLFVEVVSWPQPP